MVSNKFEVNDEIVAIQYTKMQIAKVQIESAIEMLFEGHHPVSVHTVGQAGFQIVRDIARVKNLDVLMKIERADNKFWRKANYAWSFCKHALHDSEDIFPGFKQELNELSLFWAIHLYSHLGGKVTAAMAALSSLVMTKYPEMWNYSNPNVTSEMIEASKGLTRAEFLEVGRQMIALARVKPAYAEN
ncbi:hypothetical protein [Bdellovibrio svalbardensis]|uniref:Uncharacterized protein n=1 Tax=Bdellovibrio svalbardensis TaxID=2972972 RepID=A0ABT6DGG7_9BACT|nr:hypothetical protein [Bdellovibrio svalbardensis]MDG0815940.1 hypothetical protein [Bdellovibrio svalbardensis]